MTAEWAGLAAPSILALGCALAIDHFFGEPANALHPVVFMGKLISMATPKRARGRAQEMLLGGMLALLLPMVLALLAVGLLSLLAAWPWVAFGLHVLLLKSMFSLAGLRLAGERMRSALAVDVAHGREALSWLCSRDPSTLDKPALLAATVESVAENASDSFVAPLLFYALWGLPGAVFYRTVNTMDAMIGYHGRFEYFGKAAARLDDVLNFVPARVTTLALLLAGLLRRANVRNGLRVLARDRQQTESPNAGWPMAAMAGLLDVSLEKAGHYRLGDGPAPADPAIIGRAFDLVLWAAMLVVVIVVVCLGVA